MSSVGPLGLGLLETSSSVGYIPELLGGTSPFVAHEVDLPTFDVISIEWPSSQDGEERRNVSPQNFSVKGIRALSQSDEYEISLGVPGAHHALMRVTGDSPEGLGEGTVFLFDRTTLGRMGPGIHLRPVVVSFEPDQYQDPWSSKTWLPVARLHRPNRLGCHSTLTIGTTESATVSATFSFPGVGIGESTTKTVGLKHEYNAEETCKEHCVRGDVAVVFGTTLIDSQPVAYGSRVVISQIYEDEESYADLPPERDSCGWPEKQMPPIGRSSKSLSNATGGSGDGLLDGMSIGKSTSGSMSIGVEVAKVPITLAISYNRESEYEATVETTLATGADYVGYRPRPDNPIERCWSVV